MIDYFPNFNDRIAPLMREDVRTWEYVSPPTPIRYLGEVVHGDQVSDEQLRWFGQDVDGLVEAGLIQRRCMGNVSGICLVANDGPQRWMLVFYVESDVPRSDIDGHVGWHLTIAEGELARMRR